MRYGNARTDGGHVERTAPALDQVIAAVRELDMDDVRAKVAAANAGSARVGSA